MVPTDEERRYQISSARFCSQTFVEEKDLPQGQKLLTCGRCRETCYVSREAQLENWPHHKHSCRRLSEDHPVVRDSQGFESSIHCLNEIQNCLQNPLGKIRGRLLLYGLQQLLTSANCGSLTMTRGGAEIVSAVEYQQFEESIFKKAIALLVSALNMDFGPAGKGAHQLWSIPGFTNFFLSEDRFLSAVMKRWKLQGIPPPPTNKQDEKGSSMQLQLPSTSTTFVTTLLGQSDLALIEKISTSSIVCATAFGAAVERRFLQSWQCPYSRASFSLDVFADEGMSRITFFLCALSGWYRLGIRYHLTVNPNPDIEDSPSLELENAKSALYSRAFKKENEVMCGITMKDAFRIIIEDETVLDQCHSNPSTVCLTLFALADAFRKGKSDKAPWKFFTFQDRIDLLELFEEYRLSQKFAGLNDPSISVVAFWQAAVLGFSATTVFGVYDTLIGPSCRGKVGPHTNMLIQKKRQELLEEPRKDIQVYLDVIEPAYLRRQLRLKIPAMPFPDELADHIAAYLANEQVDGPHLTIIERLLNRAQV